MVKAVVGVALAPALDWMRQHQRNATDTGRSCSNWSRRSSDALRQRVAQVGGWDGTRIAGEWDAWQEAAEALIAATRNHLDLR